MTYVPILPDIALIFDLLALIDTDEMAFCTIVLPKVTPGTNYEHYCTSEHATQVGSQVSQVS